MSELVPVYINSFNHFKWLQRMVFDLTDFPGVGTITIIDNQSTNPELVEWLDTLGPTPDKNFKIIRHFENGGSRAPWTYIKKTSEYYIVTDPDLDLYDLPQDTIQILKQGLIDNPDASKAGPGLRVSDVPKEFPWHARLMSDDKSNHHKQRGWWSMGGLDTTFAMYRWDDKPFRYFDALRAPEPYMIRHLPWYEWGGPEMATYLKYLPATHKKGLYWSTLMSDSPHLLTM